MDRVDIAIVGTGAAGISAALTAKNRNKSLMLFGSGNLSTKIGGEHRIRNYPGISNVTGTELQQAFRKQLEEMDIPVTDVKITSIYSMGDYFALQSGPDLYEARCLILATGVSAGKTIPGEEENVGRGVSYCATCDASLYRGRPVLVIGYSKKEEEEARFLSEVCSSVTYLPQYSTPVHLPQSVTVLPLRPEKIERLAQEKKMLLQAADQTLYADCIFVLRDSISPGQLVPGLATEGAHIVTDRSMSTNIPGCFAAGDCTGKPYQYVKAAGEGNVAALSAVSYLDRLDHPQT